MNPLRTAAFLPLLFLAGAGPLFAQEPAKLQLKQGDHIAVIGNTLADRQQHFGWLEALIHKANPSLDLTMRNLGFSADEINVRPRSMDVPPTDAWLERVKADVILAYYGFNESFKGEAGLDSFKRELDKFIKATLAKKYNGKEAPRLVLFSPIANEDWKDANHPDVTQNNRNIALYTAAMAEVAKANNVPFVDLYQPSLALYDKSSEHFTHNGLHLTDAGDKRMAPVQFEALFGKPAPSTDGPAITKIRGAVVDKNREWMHIYRSVDQYNIYGERGHIAYKDAANPNAPGVTNNTILLQELAQRDLRTANRDQRLQAIIKGGDMKIDDSNLATVRVDSVPPNKADVKPYLGAEEAISHMKVPKGCKVELVASEEQFPELVNPVQMNWDTKGRLWVAAWPNYPETTPTTTDFDKLLVFDIDWKTGKAVKVTRFLEDLNCPTGFQFFKDGVLVMRSPNLEFVRDTNGDGKADTTEHVLDGMDAADSHHETNSMCLEPGGATYLSDGVFHRTNVETATGPVRNTDGCIYRFEPLTGKFERYVPYHFANPHGRVFDYWGNDIITDATGNDNFFAPAFSGHLDNDKHPGMQQFWNRPSRPSPGTSILTSRHFPEEFQGNFLNANVISFQGIYRAKISEEGSGLRGETIAEHLVSSDDPNFRPSAVSVAPDGSIYFCDWSQQLIGHLQHHLRDPNRDHKHGRIYRITFEGRPLNPVKPIDGQSIGTLLDLLKEPENDVRMRAKIELGKRPGAEVVAATQKWAARLDPSDPAYAHHMLEALWVHQWHNVVNQELLETLLKSPEPRARAQAVRVLCYQRDRIPNALALLKTAANDEAPRVRLEAVRAASFFAGAAARPALEVAFEAMKRQPDYYITYCYKETVRQLQDIIRERILPSDPAALSNVLRLMDDNELRGQPAVEVALLARLERKSYDLAFREKTIGELARLHGTGRAAEIVANLERLDGKGGDAEAGANALAQMLIASSKEDLAKVAGPVAALSANAKSLPVRKAGWTARVVADGNVDAAWAASAAAQDREALTAGVPLIADPALRARFQPKLAEALAGGKLGGGLLKATLQALPLTGAGNAQANFALLAGYLKDPEQRQAAASGLKQLPRESWDKAQAGPLAKGILEYAKTLDGKKRSEQDYLELAQLGMDLAAFAGEPAVARELNGLGVSVFVVKTVREQLRYDTQRIVVGKGKAFAVLFENADAMPHNFLVVEPGQHLAAGTATVAMPPDKKDPQGRAYIPEGIKVIAASRLLEGGEKEKIEIKAPDQEGVYEFVCTFPGHSALMWGELVVTGDVDAYLGAGDGKDGNHANNGKDGDAAFQAVADEFMTGYFAFSPLEAVGLGLHEYDGRLPDYSRASLEAEHKRLKEFDARLAAFTGKKQLSAASEADLRVLQLAIKGSLFGIEDAHDFDKNPMTYAGGLDFNIYLKRNYAPLEQRLRLITTMALAAPGYLANARANLTDPLPKPKVTLAIDIAKGSADFLEKDLPKALGGVRDEKLLADLRAASARASAAFRDYATWLEKERLPRADDAFALGEPRYRKFLETRDAFTLAPDKILEIGMAALKREQAAFVEAAKAVAPGKTPHEAMRELQRDHPTAESLIPDTKKNLESIRQFLIERAIITIPSEVRATVTETPPPQRAGSFASMDSPGPFEKSGAEAYYYITPVEPEWSAKEKEEWLGAFNRYTADIVSIHEAYPGHYLQFLHLNASPVSRIQKIFGSYAFTEGWAHYCEQMMVDNGYGGSGAEGAKYRLAQSDEALLRICRLCVSIKMHCKGMGVEEAVQFFRDNCYYEEKPARQEAMRGTFDPGYLFYTLGKLQLLKLREDYAKQEGSAFSLKKFHDAVCDHGQRPVRLLREALLKDPASWDQTL